MLFTPGRPGAGRRRAADADDGAPRGWSFHALRADLFRPEATALIDEIGLGNAAAAAGAAHLLLSKEQPGANAGFISYVELGINQLGAVYEGLMSYTGFFADEDLYEVAKDGDPEKGSWVVPVDRADGIARPTSCASWTRSPARPRPWSTSAGSSSSGCPGANGSSRRPTTPPRC